MPPVDPPIYVQEELVMKAENINTVNNRYKVYADGRDPVSEPLPWYSKVVVPGPIVHGDHKSPNPWSYSVDEEWLASGTVEETLKSGAFYTRQTGPFINSSLDDARIFISPSLADSAYNSALERLNAQVRGTLDLTVSAAELGSTRRMLAVTSGLTRTLEGLAQRKLGLVKRVTREVSGRYLEWRYGWQPLLSDLYGAADESLRYVLNKTKHVRATATLKYPESVSKTFPLQGVPWPAQVKGSGKHSVAIELEFDDSNTLSRWGSLNPVSIAWELTPYSFVADWFFDVGSFLRQAETGFLYKDNFIKGFVSDLDVQDYSAEINGRIDAGFTNMDLKGFYRHRKVAFTRSLLGSYPLPRLPSWEANLGSARLLSAAALLAQFLDYSPQKDPRTNPRVSSRGGFGSNKWERRASDLLLKHGLVR